MSYREMKNFIDVMCSLGYPRIISIENFRRPNFPLVLEILVWLFERFDVELDTQNVLNNEQKRVIFIKQVIHSASNKMHVKLSAKKLYQADGQAVQELLKLLALLYTVNPYSKELNGSLVATDSETDNETISQMLTKIVEFKKIRHLASDITQKGANIFDLLSKESEISEERNAILDSPLQLNELESTLRNLLSQTQKEIDAIHFRMDNVTQDEANLDAKIEKQEQELARHTQRLEQLRSMRPAYQDEFDRLEVELIRLYDEYVLKHRCLVHLEEQLDELERAEQEALQQREAAIAEMLAKSGDADEFDFLANEPNDDEESVLNADLKSTPKSMNASRPMSGRPITGRPLTSSKVRMYGNLFDGDKEDDSLDDDSFNLEDNVRDENDRAPIDENDEGPADPLKEEEEDNSELNSEEELELLQLTKNTLPNGISSSGGDKIKSNQDISLALNQSNDKLRITQQAMIETINHESDDDF